MFSYPHNKMFWYRKSISSVIGQKGVSQNGCFKKAKPAFGVPCFVEAPVWDSLFWPQNYNKLPIKLINL